jgi:predicted ATP-grasp superfamily ATP-dependent carboligase
MSVRVIIAGISTRAAAASAARAGFDVTAIDAFADLDQHPAVQALAAAPFSPDAVVRAASAVAGDAVSYLASFENHPDAVAALGTGRALWGNPPEVLRRVRDPHLLAAALRRRGLPAPLVEFQAGVRFLQKPLASGGGNGIRAWTPGRRVPEGRYLQEYVEGDSASIVFVANGHDAVVLGISRQLAGRAALGSAMFRYCGNVLDPVLAGDEQLRSECVSLARAVTEEFGLVGLNGIDVIVRDRQPVALEVNPRWSASMELVERATGSVLFDLHASACADRRLPQAAPGYWRASAARGKAIVYARQAVKVGDTRSWLDDQTVRDVPRPGVSIGRGEPVCTVLGEGADANACVAALEARAARVYAEMLSWQEALVP